ncbi:MAG: MFS transporter [Ancrocorticia sp.]|nr:MFS transporter [Ancrocorticia sp.]MCI1896646.1 MFS transporter [Ancrocorticia sp.]
MAIENSGARGDSLRDLLHHPALKVLIGCCLLYGGVVGVIGNSAGIYMVAVTDEMGWTLASYNLYLTILALVMTVTLPIAGRILPQYPFRAQLLIFGGIASVTYGLAGSFNALWQWYVAGVVLGVCYGFLMYIPIPLIVNNWFIRRNGLALGLSAAFASLIAAFVNPIGSELIENLGWREARVIVAILALCFIVPAVAFFLRLNPSDVGARPYGESAARADSATKDTETAPVAERFHFEFSARNPVFWFIWLAGGLFALSATMLQQAPSHAARIGLDPAVGAIGVSAIMIGGIAFKLLLGILNDKTNTIVAAVASAGLGACGALLVVLAGDNAAGFLAGCVLFGGGYAGLVVIPPLTVRYFFGTEGYGRIYSYVTFALGAFSAIGPVFYSWISDQTGNFVLAWASCIGFYALIAALVAISTKMLKSAEKAEKRKEK